MYAAAAAALLVVTMPHGAHAQNGHGNGNGQGQGQAHGQGAGRGQERAKGPGGSAENRGPERRQPDQADRGRGNGNAPARVSNGPDRGQDGSRAPARAPARAPERVDRTPGVVRAVDSRQGDRRDAVVLFRGTPDRGLITGCPPGLAKKDNGCLPPGQARQIARDYDRYDRYGYLWNVRSDDYNYRYRDGYLYRMSPQGSLLGYLPVLGGALWTGSTWPAQYAYEPVPSYYSTYYGLNDRNAWRYADGVVYGVDPQTQAITQIAALLTGQDWNVGQRMPAGYDIYNVPYAYRGQYMDSPQAMYRYSDGYVYQVDPQTRLIQTAIQLLT
jgi:hypothetical protein